MSKLEKVFVICDKAAAYAELCSGAKQLGEECVLVYAGEKDAAVGADRAYWLGELSETRRWPALIPAVVSLVKEEKPALVLFNASRNGRLTAGMLAAELSTTVLTDLSKISVSDGAVSGRRLVYGGAGIMTAQALGDTALAVLSAGCYEAVCTEKVENIKEVSVEEDTGCKCTGVQKKEVSSVNLSAAKRIVGVGRGIQDAETLELAKALSAAVGAELGCTRPVAEEMMLMPREAYIGISGVNVKPEVYLAVGVSGQVQHTVGIEDSGIIAAVNKDAKAPIFADCDLGIVGDLNKILPLLTAKFQEEN